MGNEQTAEEDHNRYNEERFKHMMRKYMDTNFGCIHSNGSEWIHTLDDYMELGIAISLKEYEKKHLACCLKLKTKFMKWLWKAREKISMKKYHPNKVIKLLETGLDINTIDDLNIYFETA